MNYYFSYQFGILVSEIAQCTYILQVTSNYEYIYEFSFAIFVMNFFTILNLTLIYI